MWGGGQREPAIRCQSRHKTGREGSISTYRASVSCPGVARSAWLGGSSCRFLNLKLRCVSCYPVCRCHRLPLNRNKTATSVWVDVKGHSKICLLHLTHKQGQSEGWVNDQNIQMEMTPCPGTQMLYAPSPDTGKSLQHPFPRIPNSPHSVALLLPQTQPMALGKAKIFRRPQCHKPTGNTEAVSLT